MAKKFTDAPFDKQDSTYMQKITFVNGKVILGYSKRVGFAEIVDPTNCITNFILRMFRDEYLRPSQKVDPVESITYSLNKPPYDWIVTCYYRYFDLSSEWILNKRFSNWITSFYDDINAGKSTEYIIKKYYRSGRVSNIDELNFNNHAFTRPDHLVKYAVKLHESGKYPPEQIKHFYINAKEKYFSGQDTENYDRIVSNLLQNYTKKK